MQRKPSQPRRRVLSVCSHIPPPMLFSTLAPLLCSILQISAEATRTKPINSTLYRQATRDQVVRQRLSPRQVRRSVISPSPYTNCDQAIPGSSAYYTGLAVQAAVVSSQRALGTLSLIYTLRTVCIRSSGRGCLCLGMHQHSRCVFRPSVRQCTVLSRLSIQHVRRLAIPRRLFGVAFSIPMPAKGRSLRREMRHTSKTTLPKS